MSEITREQLRAYLDDHLSEPEMARVEKALRASPQLRADLETVRQEREGGEHTLGGIWETDRLTCPTREQLGGYLLKTLDPGFHSYIEFHLQTINCPYCQANLDDLAASGGPEALAAHERRRRLFEATRDRLHDADPESKLDD